MIGQRYYGSILLKSSNQVLRSATFDGDSKKGYITMKKSSILAAGLTLFAIGEASANDYIPRGFWRLYLVIESETGEVNELTLSSASYPATCVSGLLTRAKKTEAANGYVWTDPDATVVGWSESDIATVRHEVIEFRCSFERSPNED
ncbi:hypothetical protein RA27_05580 [Ruegeria sp. ANG-R]|nr:hypothetical protein RA27_05580 [Ruegeria sp. ANG-R]